MTVFFRTISGVRLKPCTRCGIVKALDEFYLYKTGKQAGRRFSWCKECCRTYSRERARANVQRSRAQCREYYARNAEQHKARTAADRRARRAAQKAEKLAAQLLADASTET